MISDMLSPPICWYKNKRCYHCLCKKSKKKERSMQNMRVPFLGLFFVLVGDNVVAVLLDVVLVVVVGVVAENVKKNRERGKVSRFSF